jgi:hypothetical protein
MEESHWVDETTLEVRLRKGLRYQGGEEFSAESFRWAFEEVQRVVLEAHRDHWNRDAEGARLHDCGPGRPSTWPSTGPARRGGLRRPRPPARRADPTTRPGCRRASAPHGHDPDQALSVFLCAPGPVRGQPARQLRRLRNHLELAETEVAPAHWSRR